MAELKDLKANTRVRANLDAYLGRPAARLDAALRVFDEHPPNGHAEAVRWRAALFDLMSSEAFRDPDEVSQLLGRRYAELAVHAVPSPSPGNAEPRSRRGRPRTRPEIDLKALVELLHAHPDGISEAALTEQFRTRFPDQLPSPSDEARPLYFALKRLRAPSRQDGSVLIVRKGKAGATQFKIAAHPQQDEDGGWVKGLTGSGVRKEDRARADQASKWYRRHRFEFRRTQDAGDEWLRLAVDSALGAGSTLDHDSGNVRDQEPRPPKTPEYTISGELKSMASFADKATNKCGDNEKYCKKCRQAGAGSTTARPCGAFLYAVDDTDSPDAFSDITDVARLRLVVETTEQVRQIEEILLSVGLAFEHKGRDARHPSYRALHCDISAAQLVKLRVTEGLPEASGADALNRPLELQVLTVLQDAAGRVRRTLVHNVPEDRRNAQFERLLVTAFGQLELLEQALEQGLGIADTHQRG